MNPVKKDQHDLFALATPDPNEIRGLSLTEPWAWAVRNKWKQYETRSWRTDYRGLVAIHAARRLPTGAALLDVLDLRKWLWQEEGLQMAEVEKLPRGCVVALARLTDCQRTQDVLPTISARERALGDYTPGRWAWRLEDIRPLGLLIECKGALGLWHLTPQLAQRVRNSADIGDFDPLIYSPGVVA